MSMGRITSQATVVMVTSVAFFPSLGKKTPAVPCHMVLYNIVAWFLFVCFWWAWDLNSGLHTCKAGTHKAGVLLLEPHTSSFFYGYFGGEVLQNIWWGWPWTIIFHTSASQVARIKGMSHLSMANGFLHQNMSWGGKRVFQKHGRYSVLWSQQRSSTLSLFVIFSWSEARHQARHYTPKEGDYIRTWITVAGIFGCHFEIHLTHKLNFFRHVM
jgi:hypothetical protein